MNKCKICSIPIEKGKYCTRHQIQNDARKAETWGKVKETGKKIGPFILAAGPIIWKKGKPIMEKAGPIIMKILRGGR
jgi:hypothetical protein